MRRLALLVALLLAPSLATAETVITVAAGTYSVDEIVTQSGTPGDWIRYRPLVADTVTIEGGGDITHNYVILDGFLFDASLDPDMTDPGRAFPRGRGMDVFGNPVRIENSEVRGVNDIHNGYNPANESLTTPCKEFGDDVQSPGTRGINGHGIRVAAGGSLTITDSEVWGFRDAFTINAPDAEVTIERTLVRNNFNGVSQEGKTVIIKDSVFWDTPNHQFAIKEDNTVADSLFHLENNLLINSQDMVKLGEAWEGADNAYIVHNTFWLPADDPCGEYAGLSLGFVRDSLVIKDNILVSLRNGLLQGVATEFFTRDGGDFMDSDYNLIFQHDPLTSEQPPDEWPDEFRLDGPKVKYETWAADSCAAGDCQDANSIVRQDPLFVAAPIYNITPLAEEELPQPGTPANEWGWEVPTSIAEVEGWFALDPNSPAIGAASDGLNIGYNVPVGTVEQWHRTTIDTGVADDDATCDAVTGSRDEVQFQATFTHSGGTKITMPGYYDPANNRYSVDFMPTLTGTWTWATCSVDDCSATGVPDLTLDSAMDCASLDGITSTPSTAIVATEGYLEDGITPHPGQFEPDGNGKWRFSDSGEYVVPLGLRTSLFWEVIADTTNSPPGNFVFDPNMPDFIASADYLLGMGFNFLETNVFDGEGVYDPNGVIGATPRRYNYAFDGAGGVGQSSYNDYDMEELLWDRFVERHDVLTERNIGVQIMPYQDTPVAFCGLTGSTAPGGCDFNDSGRAGGGAEALLIRYMVARTAAQPFIWYNYAIDYEDIRTEADADAYLARLALLDPYGHPASVRHKDEPGGPTQPEATPQTYDSDGDEANPIFADMLDVVEREVGAQTNCNGGPCSVSFDDSFWEESYSCISDVTFRRSTPEVARRAAFKMLMLGGMGAHFRGADGTPCAPEASCSTRRSEWYFWLGDDGSGNSCFNQAELWSPTVDGTTVINEIVTVDLGADFANMWPNPSDLDGTAADVTQSGDVNEWALFDAASPDKILLYAIGPDDEAPPVPAGAGDKCASCDGRISVNVSDQIFAGYTYSGEWINPRTGDRSPMNNPTDTLVGGVTPNTEMIPPSPLDDDWLLLLTTGGQVPACNDGQDNDGDGLTDWAGGDPGCLDATDTSEREVGGPACDDTANNDLDPHTDYPDDPGCLGPGDVSEFSGVCSGGSEPGTDCVIDGDCAGGGQCNQLDCDDGQDNDGDGFFDYDSDTDCPSALGTSEAPSGEECGNGLDDDNDGYIDLADVGCNDSLDTVEGTRDGDAWHIDCTSDSWRQTVPDLSTAGGGITVTFNCDEGTVISVDTVGFEQPQILNGADTNIIDGPGTSKTGVIFEPTAANQWRNRDVCEGSSGGDPNECDINADGAPDFCPQCSDENPPIAGGCWQNEEQSPRFLIVRSDNNIFRDFAFRWYADGFTFDDGFEATGNQVINVLSQFPGDNGFRNEGEAAAELLNGTDDPSAQNQLFQDLRVENACDKAFQSQGRDVGLVSPSPYTDVNDFDVTYDGIECWNCNQGLRFAESGRYLVKDAEWLSVPGIIPAGTPAGFYDCDSMIRQSDEDSMVILDGNVQISGCVDNNILLEGDSQLIARSTGNAVFDGANDAIELRGNAKASIAGTSIQNNSLRGIYLNSTTAEVDCGGGMIQFTQPDDQLSSVGGNVFAGNGSFDVDNGRAGYTISCKQNVFDCPDGPQVNGDVDTDPLAAECTAPLGSTISGATLQGVEGP